MSSQQRKEEFKLEHISVSHFAHIIHDTKKRQNLMGCDHNNHKFDTVEYIERCIHTHDQLQDLYHSLAIVNQTWWDDVRCPLSRCYIELIMAKNKILNENKTMGDYLLYEGMLAVLRTSIKEYGNVERSVSDVERSVSDVERSVNKQWYLKNMLRRVLCQDLSDVQLNLKPLRNFIELVIHAEVLERFY
jgi:hypothetical protein